MLESCVVTHTYTQDEANKKGPGGCQLSHPQNVKIGQGMCIGFYAISFGSFSTSTQYF